MHRFVYSAVFYLLIPAILLRLLLRSLKAPDYRRRISERFALQSPDNATNSETSLIWIHAVSVGETVASAPLVRELQHRYPEHRILLTTMTPTGSDRVRALFGESVSHCYIPYDLPGACNRFLSKYRPSILILMETELWPNLVHACHRRGVPLLLANARLSEKSATGYGRFGKFTKSLLERIDTIAAQASPDAERFVALGASAERVQVTGSLKFIVDIHEKKSEPFFDSLGQASRPKLVAASTREGEEEKVLTAFQKILESQPSLLMVLIPRHPERFNKVYALSEQMGLTTIRRSSGEDVGSDTQVVIGDSMGEMIDYYGLATVAFVGGSLVDTGCQNVLEPAAMGIPVLVGPSQYNFATICTQLESCGALRTVQDESELAQLVVELLANETERIQMGAKGKKLVEQNQNALPALMRIVERLIQTDG